MTENFINLKLNKMYKKDFDNWNKGKKDLEITTPDSLPLEI